MKTHQLNIWLPWLWIYHKTNCLHKRNWNWKMFYANAWIIIFKSICIDSMSLRFKHIKYRMQICMDLRLLVVVIVVSMLNKIKIKFLMFILWCDLSCWSMFNSRNSETNQIHFYVSLVWMFYQFYAYWFAQQLMNVC